MAAFEAISRIAVRPLNELSFIDFRTARLPYDRQQMDDFDPRDFREPKSPIKLWMAYFNLIRTIFGAGVLGLPLAISQVGIVLGPLMAIATGFLIIHTHLMLLGSLNEISRQLKIPYISYRYGFRLAILHGPPCLEFIGNYGPTIIATFMFLSQFGICTVFVIFTSDSLRDIMDWKNNKPAMLVLLLPYLLLEFFMKSLKIVSYVSMFGNFLNLIGLILVLYLIFDDPHGEMVLAQGDPLSIFFAFGTYLFNLSAVGVMLSIDKALKDPKILTKQFGIISIGIMIPTIFTTIFGCLGYWSFGSMEENILRSLPFDSLLSMTAIGLYLIAVAFAFPIQCYPGIQIVVEVIKNRHVYDTPSDHTLWLIETISRPLFVLATFSVCFAIPFQGPFVAFVGNMCTTQLALVFPALMEICLLYPSDYGKYKVYLIKDLAIIFLGLASFVFGVILCGNLIYIRFMSTFSPNNSEYF